jgi:hypothetical protein
MGFGVGYETSTTGYLELGGTGFIFSFILRKRISLTVDLILLTGTHVVWV